MVLGGFRSFHVLVTTLYFGKSVHNEPLKKIYMFFFDY